MKIKDKPAPPKATFLRKSAFMTTGAESFRFNFNLGSDQADRGHVVSTANMDASSSNIEKPVHGSGDTNAPKKALNTNEFKINLSESQFKFNFNITE